MKGSVRPRRLAALAVVLIAASVYAGGASSRTGRAASRPVTGDTPAAVAHGQAGLHGRHNPNDVLTLNVGLAVRDSGQLDALIKSGTVLTDAQYMADYAPTDAEAAATRAWLTAQGLTVTGTTPDNLLIHVTGRTRDVEAAFGVTINDYTEHGRSFHANDHDPTVASGLNVNWISGLSNYDVFKPALTCTNPGPPASGCSFDGGDLQAIYDSVKDYNGIKVNGTGQTLGFTLWGGSLPQSDYTSYANATGTTALTIGQAGDDGLDFVQVDGAGTNSSGTDGEIALDTQNAHGVAPGIHETYWLGKDNTNSTLEDVLNAAENSSLSIISNSWGIQSNPCPVDGNMETTLQKAAAKGQTFLFATLDGGASAGCAYPAESRYAIAVGGTSLSTTAGPTYSSESAVNNGGGCLPSATEPRPSWQTGIGSPQVWGPPQASCDGRATPDVSAISGFCSDNSNCGPGTFIFFDGSASCCFGGTSLATPLWAAEAVLWDKNNSLNGRPALGFFDPLLYALANDATTYARDYHDVTTGTNGFAAGAGWDEATGWGSADFDKLANNVADVTYSGPVQVDTGQAITLSGSLLDQGASTQLATAGLVTHKLSFAAGFDNCDATVDSSGNASCNVTVSSDPGRYKAIAAFAGDAAYRGGSQTVDFLVNGIPTKLVDSGGTSTDYNDAVTLSATLTDASNASSFSSGDPIQGETISFTLGAESCSGTTDASGVASCSVTPLDDPGSYTVSASFGGDDPVYASSSDSAPFTLNQEESSLAYTGSTTVHYHDALTASGTLTDPDGGAAIAGKTLTFTLGTGETCTTGATDSAGKASCTITPTHTGTTTIGFSFGGDTDYLSSSDSTAFSITPEETTMTYTGPTVILAGASGATLTATLLEDGAADSDGDSAAGVPPNPAETVTLFVGTQHCSAATTSTGSVTCTIPSISVPLGPETVKATFAGDAYYQTSSDSKGAIVFAFPSHGVFTLGDNSVAAAVATPTTTLSWWNNNWYLANSLSGGLAPSSFKGFVASTTVPTTTPANICKSTWSTSTGNSPPPPPTVPGYMGVIVATKVTKSGNTLKGDYVSVIVVKTNPGYAPGPQNLGTGTYVATFCTG